MEMSKASKVPNRATVTLRISTKLMNYVDMAATRRHMSRAELARQALEQLAMDEMSMNSQRRSWIRRSIVRRCMICRALYKDNEWTELDLGWKHSCKPEASEIIFTLDTVK